MVFIDLISRPTKRYFRARSTLSLFENHLEGITKLIDIGAGTCRISKYIRENFQVNVVPLDIVDYNKTDLKLTLYDGKRIPFKDGAFDVALLVFVIHHSDDQEMVLNEAIRVARKLIILEDTPRNPIEVGMWHFWDWLLNLGRDFSMPHSSRKDEDWLCLFESLGFKLVEKKCFRLGFSFFWSYQQSLYVLERRRR
jgi:SAM-dependent methyltransferase